MNRTQKQMEVAVNQITAKIDVVDTNDDDNKDSVSDSSDSDTTNDTSQDFHQGGDLIYFPYLRSSNWLSL